MALDAATVEAVDRTRRYAADVAALSADMGDELADLFVATHRAGLTDDAAIAFVSAAVPGAMATHQVTADIVGSYVNDSLEAAGAARLAPVNLGDIDDIRKARIADVYARPVADARRAVARGVPLDEALDASAARIRGIVADDVANANRLAAADMMGRAGTRVTGYRRVLTGQSCSLCAAASTKRYGTGLLMPIHHKCDCAVAPIIGTSDPGQVINHALLSDLRGASSRPDYWRDSALRVMPDGSIYRVGRRGDDLAGATSYADEIAATAKARARGATRVTDDIVDDAGDLTGGGFMRAQVDEVDSLDTFTDDELKAARAEVNAIRDAAKLEARETMTEQFNDLQISVYSDARAGIKPPNVVTKKNAAGRTVKVAVDPDTGRNMVGGEWDWYLEMEGPEARRFKQRMSNNGWINNRNTPSMDDLLEELDQRGQTLDDWLAQVQLHDDAKALAAGRPPPGADLNAIAPTTADDARVDLTQLFAATADDPDEWQDAATRLVAEAMRREAELADDAIGWALEGSTGESPFLMSVDDWYDEVLDLDYAIKELTPVGLDDAGGPIFDDAGEALVARYRELVPPELDPTGQLVTADPQALHDAIVDTARAAGRVIDLGDF